MSDYDCPICGIHYREGSDKIQGKKICSEIDSTDGEFVHLYCSYFNTYFYLHQYIAYMEKCDLKEKFLNLITEHIVHSNICEFNGGKQQWYFYFNDLNDCVYSRYPNYVNLANLIKNYPISVTDVACRSLVNYSFRYPRYGDEINPQWPDRRLSFENKMNNTHSAGVIQILTDLGYTKDPDENGHYIITAKGWQKIDDLKKEEQIIQQGFIAMSFRNETQSIREAFRTAISESGYSVAIIDEKEHNNQIVPEIFYEIERSKFVVVDVTYPNYGAYYEAGYAQALGKQVIICCRETEFKSDNVRPHFDISQKSMVVWKDESDLVARLKRRIEATVK